MSVSVVSSSFSVAADYAAVTGPSLEVREGDAIVVLGDSITSTLYQWYGPLKADVDYTFTANGKTPPTWINSGISGNQTADVVGNETSRVLQYSPTVLIDFLGFNDCHNNGVTPIDTATSVANKTSYFGTILAARNNLRVMMIGPCIYGGIRPNGSNPFDVSLNDHNSAFSEFARARNWPYVNTRLSYFSDTSLDPAVLFTDGIHPTAAGTSDGAGDRWFSMLARRRINIRI